MDQHRPPGAAGPGLGLGLCQGGWALRAPWQLVQGLYHASDRISMGDPEGLRSSSQAMVPSPWQRMQILPSP